MRDALRSLVRRLSAYAVDVVVLAAVLVPLAFVIQRVVGYRPHTGVGVWLASLATISFPSWLYFTLSDASSRGVTLGKRLLGLRASTVEGGRIGRGRALARTATKLVPWELTHLMFFALFLAVALRNRGERSLHDLAAGTAVRRRQAA